MGDPSRRRLLATVGIGAAAVAGCVGLGPSDEATDTTVSDGPEGQVPTNETDDPTSSTATTTPESGQASDPGTATASPLDLREANVVDVGVTAEGDGHRFDIALHHDDPGEDGYANWWQVETPGGERLGRRDLLHAHPQQPFTRSATISIPDGVDCVVVRGHDETHGYGGRAVIVGVGTGTTRAVRQGSEPEPFADAVCPGEE